MMRDLAILGVAMVALQVAPPAAHATLVTQTNLHKPHHRAIVAPRIATVPRKAVKRQIARVSHATAASTVAIQLPTPDVETTNGAPTSLAFHFDPAGDIPVLPNTPLALSDQESEAGQLADAQGDKTFLMIDKALGKIILFENGQPVFAGPALTGASTADQIPKTELAANFDSLNAQNTKITPAGRYTVRRGFDPEVGGPLFDIGQIRGKDWGIAIHQLYLGIPSEHRDVRILSQKPDDKHITYGCINIQTATMRLLIHELPERDPIPLYILPEDPSQTAAYLTPHTSS